MGPASVGNGNVRENWSHAYVISQTITKIVSKGNRPKTFKLWWSLGKLRKNDMCDFDANFEKQIGS